MKQKFTSEQNKRFWDNDAIEKKDNPIGTHSDPNLVELENNFIVQVLKSGKFGSVLDIGCGNGQRTIFFSKFTKKIKGIDYSLEMINQANHSLNKKNSSLKTKISFENADIHNFNTDTKYDAIISCRCFINNTKYKNQVVLYQKLHSMLKKNGSLIIAEGSQEGYDRLNYFRNKFHLTPIKIPWYNLPISEKIVHTKIRKLFKIQKINRLGMYYFLTRVIYPTMIYPKSPNPKSHFNEISKKSEMLFQEQNTTVESIEKIGAHLLIHFRKI